MKIKSDTIIRTVVTGLALINSVLVMLGKMPLPWSNDELYEGLSAVLAVTTTAWSWWKNNSFSRAAIQADEYMEELKSSENNRESV